MHVSFLFMKVIDNYSGILKKFMCDLHDYSRNGGGTTECQTKWAIIKMIDPNEDC